MKKILLIYAFLSVFAYAQLDNKEYFHHAIPEIGKTWQAYVILGSGAAVSGLAMMADENVRSRMTERQYLPPVLDHVADSYVDHYWAFGVSAMGAVAKGYQTDNYLKPLRYWAMSNVSTVALTYALKFSVRRTRPNGRNDLSYPSGHTSVAFATASMFQMWYGWKAGVPAYAMAVMTAFQRMDDDQHWLSDVVMGAAVGIAIPYMIYKGEENAESGICPAVPPHFRQHSLQFPFGKIMKQKISRKTVSELMKWFRRHSREMPWRGSKDPYHIWVSEMMLQQTQVGTVRKYYSRWIERFPDIFSLADASLEEVLKVWEGLGYYTRARNFHKGAKYIAENTSSYGKDFPDNYEDWLKVPGVGPYTAAAVSSIAFAYPAGVLDANVLRVMSRLFCTDINTRSQAVKRELFEKISRSFYEYHPGWVNQAWMELGSLQCKKNAVCFSCPLKEMCCAYRKQEVERYPKKKEKKPVPIRHGAAFIVTGGSRTLMVRRRPEGFLGGLWEYPGYTLKKETADPQYLASFLEDNYLEIIKKSETSVRHAYSHFIQHIDLYCASVKGKWENVYWDKARWVNTEDIRSLPRSGLAIKIGKIAEAL